MQFVEQIENYLKNFNTYLPTMNVGDVLEIFFIALLLYYILVWMKSSRAWALLKGLIVIFAFVLFADLFQMTTILWIAKNVLSFAIIAMIVVLQPELRRALEDLGKKNILTSVIPFDNGRGENDSISERTINEIVKASFEMGKVRTGALIVIERIDSLREYERTGIDIDAILSSQLLINIFEHNTPLHDGAVLVRGNRIVSATCYLPLSDNTGLSKELGTRHRAGVGISENSDSVTVIVSEETGKVSVAMDGRLDRRLDADSLREKLGKALLIKTEEKTKTKRKWKGRNQS